MRIELNGEPRELPPGATLDVAVRESGAGEGGRGVAVALDGEVVKSRPKLEEYAGRPVVLGIRPESLEDASLATDIPADRHIKGVLVLREPLGSEIIAHFEVDAPPALTEDVRELARDVGSEGTVQAPSEGDTKTTLVGRFGPRSRVKSGDVIDVAVDTRAVHLFDAETSAGIYD
jgi:multiple sugar transport system ATP-binding protein